MGQQADQQSVQQFEATPKEGPDVSSIKDLYAFGEAFTTVNGKPQLKYTFVCFLDSNNVAYFGHTPVSKFNLTGKILRECLKQIPDQEIYPEPPVDITLFSGSVTDCLYIKHPDLKSWDDYQGQDFISKLFLNEVKALELLHHHPHPNIVSYHGCTVNRGRITGIVLDRYATTLQDRLKDGAHDFNKDCALKDIESAVRHLHSLGLAHNDLNPANIMLDQNDRTILIDFGSCKPFGQRLQEAGTVGWIDEHYFFSEKQHDEIALQKIESWVKEMTAM